MLSGVISRCRSHASAPNTARPSSRGKKTLWRRTQPYAGNAHAQRVPNFGRSHLSAHPPSPAPLMYPVALPRNSATAVLIMAYGLSGGGRGRGLGGASQKAREGRIDSGAIVGTVVRSIAISIVKPIVRAKMKSIVGSKVRSVERPRDSPLIHSQPRLELEAPSAPPSALSRHPSRLHTERRCRPPSGKQRIALR